MVAENGREEVQDLCRRLSMACGRAGLTAEEIAPTRIRVGFPGAGMLAEIIRCMPDSSERLHWWWSWGDPICPAEEIDQAVEMIVHVVRPE
ncbi:hypothetical protein GCM10010151_49440 [Actinoallomurus spadix]|uniref:Uncharacterized protein n=1 Tax=Actinoallomurus spadix TaxID=79912 RepID=A0ABP3GST6_9ACTN